jgi:RNA recognition motif-containing protein
MVTRTKKIFVGGLSAPTTLEDVKNYFEQFGPVSTNVNFLISFLLYLYIHTLSNAPE